MTAPTLETDSPVHADVGIPAPDGAHWELEDLSTAQGKESLGEVPMLVWDTFSGCVAHYTEEKVMDTLNGSSFRNTYQGIGRRLKVAGKSNAEIAQAILDWKPGLRAAQSPETRAKRAAADATKVVGGDAIALLLKRIARGEISVDENGQFVG